MVHIIGASNGFYLQFEALHTHVFYFNQCLNKKFILVIWLDFGGGDSNIACFGLKCDFKEVWQKLN